MSGNQFLKTELILAGGNWFSGQWIPFSSIVSYIFQVVRHQSQKLDCTLFRAFFPASENQYLLATIFFDFFDIPVNGSSFFF